MAGLYFDNCCLNRPFDDQTQPRIRLEAEAILVILRQIEQGTHSWIASDALDIEIRRSPDKMRQERVRALASTASSHVKLGTIEARRAKEVGEMGFGAYDALHIACAESGKAEVLLTTDDKLIRRAAARSTELHIRVVNPLVWLTESGMKEQ